MDELVGYARVSTLNQDYSLHVEQLEKYGCTKISHEKKSGKNTGKPELNKALESSKAIFLPIFILPGDFKRINFILIDNLSFNSIKSTG